MGVYAEFVGRMGTLPFPETLTSEQEMTAIIGKVLNALETSDIGPASEDEMRTLLTLCQSWGYSALCSGSKGEVTANLGRLIWATRAKRIKPPPFGPFGPESVQKARSCQMERKCQFLTADLRGDSNVFSHVVAKTKDGYSWFAGQSVKATEKTSCSGVAAGTGSKPRAAKEAPSKEPVQAKAKTIDDPMGTVGCLALLRVVACTGLLWWLSPPTIPLWAKIVATCCLAAFGLPRLGRETEAKHFPLQQINLKHLCPMHRLPRCACDGDILGDETERGADPGEGAGSVGATT